MNPPPCWLCGGTEKLGRRHKDGDAWAPITKARETKGWFDVRPCPGCAELAKVRSDLDDVLRKNVALSEMYLGGIQKENTLKKERDEAVAREKKVREENGHYGAYVLKVATGWYGTLSGAMEVASWFPIVKRQEAARAALKEGKP